VKGIINKGFQEFVEASFGTETWEKVKSQAGCEEPFFAVSLSYPDETTVALVKACAEVTGLSPEQVMLDFGRFMVPNTLKRDYAIYFALAGSSAREFLHNMTRVHELMTRGIPGAMPPRFRYEDLPDGRLLMHYDSERGLCAVLRGLIHGVGIVFNQQLEVRETACRHRGDPCCTMEVSFSQ
jgi:hypothetical protein